VKLSTKPGDPSRGQPFGAMAHPGPLLEPPLSPR